MKLFFQQVSGTGRNLHWETKPQDAVSKIFVGSYYYIGTCMGILIFWYLIISKKKNENAQNARKISETYALIKNLLFNWESAKILMGVNISLETTYPARGCYWWLLGMPRGRLFYRHWLPTSNWLYCGQWSNTDSLV